MKKYLNSSNLYYYILKNINNKKIINSLQLKLYKIELNLELKETYKIYFINFIYFN